VAWFNSVGTLFVYTFMQETSTRHGRSRKEVGAMIRKIREQRIEQSWEAWKGTVLMVGLTALLMLLSGCYTMLATSSGGSLTDRYVLDDYEVVYAEPEEYYAVEDPGDFAGQDVAAGEYGVEAYDPESAEGVGVRYRGYYEEGMGDYDYYLVEEPQEVVVVSYRRPWIRRLYVDWYYDWAFGWGLHPMRHGRVWSVGWSFAGFGIHYGSYYWYDPFYWDSWWYEPCWNPCYTVWGWPYYDPWWYWDPWHWDPWYYHNPWHWHRGYYAYHPGYYYWDGYYYGGYRGPGVIVAKDYNRRSTDRRRGLADTRDARGVVSDRTLASTGNAGRRSSDRTGTAAGTRTTTGARTDAATQRRTSRTATGTGATGVDARNTTTRTQRTTGTTRQAETALERAKRQETKAPENG